MYLLSLLVNAEEDDLGSLKSVCISFSQVGPHLHSIFDDLAVFVERQQQIKCHSEDFKVLFYRNWCVVNNYLGGRIYPYGPQCDVLSSKHLFYL